MASNNDKANNNDFIKDVARLSENIAANAKKHLNKLDATEKLVAAYLYNANKAREYGKDSSHPPQGQTLEISHSICTGSTLTESSESKKIGNGKAHLGPIRRMKGWIGFA